MNPKTLITNGLKNGGWTGEPTLYPKINEIISYAKRIKLNVILNTNGLRTLENIYPDCFIISFDGPPSIHETIRGKGTFKKLVKNLGTTNIKKIGLMAISKINLNHIEETAKLG